MLMDGGDTGTSARASIDGITLAAPMAQQSSIDMMGDTPINLMEQKSMARDHHFLW